ncbi:DUF6089 family protein [Elizabethkingia sp. JS20170427COW]|uniref:DUF6089 family protein n=1 Tax=Elizabethkingia sp. JS20170427COW TaxID=2583851 RepID=UPI0011105FB7|nr:DUF6089 family protein [Elizabethkingia sp. JS20170427COW]QCX53304.1 hypothetical protein FGE20_05935 [Elizabethkingia sp. JS20170427COW]
MKHLIYIVLFLGSTLLSLFKTQRYELGLQLGGSNLVGDIGRTNYIYPFPAKDISTFGVPIYANLLFKMNFNPHQSLRFNLGTSHVYFSDAFAKENYRRTRKDSNGRNFQGTNNITTAEVLFEYNFLPINNEQRDGMLSPYVFAGLGAMFYSKPSLVAEHTFNNDSNGNPMEPTGNDDFATSYTIDTKGGMTFSIPFGVGLKYKFNYNWTIFGEVMFRPSFADDLDYSKIENKSVKNIYDKRFDKDGNYDEANKGKSLLQTQPYLDVANERVNKALEDRVIGNPNSKDWINTISIGLTYSFGRPPCYCD